MHISKIYTKTLFLNWLVKTNEKITIKLDYFGQYGKTRTTYVYTNGINDKKIVKCGAQWYFVTENGNLYQ